MLIATTAARGTGGATLGDGDGKGKRSFSGKLELGIVSRPSIP
jgi:hypothetical protein